MLTSDTSILDSSTSEVVQPPTNTINGDDQNNLITTTAQNDLVNAFGGNDFIQGSRGNDTINGGIGTDTVSYSRLGGPIRLGATGTVNKGRFGSDNLNGVEKIIASQAKGDVIDASAANGTARIEVDLSSKTLNVLDVPGIPTGLSFTVENFEDVIGTQNNDKITGDSKNNSLTGGAGDDILAGTNGVGTFPGLGEVDLLTGGDGNDTFILGRGSTLYYNGNGNSDFAKIADFTFGADQIFLANGNYALNADETALFAVNVGTDGAESLDLIAKIAYSGGVESSFRTTTTQALSEASGDPLTATKTFSLADGQSFGAFSAAVV